MVTKYLAIYNFWWVRWGCHHGIVEPMPAGGVQQEQGVEALWICHPTPGSIGHLGMTCQPRELGDFQQGSHEYSQASSGFQLWCHQLGCSWNAACQAANLLSIKSCGTKGILLHHWWKMRNMMRWVMSFGREHRSACFPHSLGSCCIRVVASYSDSEVLAHLTVDSVGVMHLFEGHFTTGSLLLVLNTCGKGRSGCCWYGPICAEPPGWPWGPPGVRFLAAAAKSPEVFDVAGEHFAAWWNLSDALGEAHLDRWVWHIYMGGVPPTTPNRTINDFSSWKPLKTII